MHRSRHSLLRAGRGLRTCIDLFALCRGDAVKGHLPFGRLSTREAAHHSSGAVQRVSQPAQEILLLKTCVALLHDATLCISAHGNTLKDLRISGHC